MVESVCDFVVENDCAFVSGAINFETVNAVYEKGVAYIAEVGTPQIDFAKVSYCNSAVIALLVEWVKLARAQDKKIRFVELPDAVHAMLKVARMEMDIFN